MKAKVKSGKELLDAWNNLTLEPYGNEYIIDFKDKGEYLGFSQKGNKLTVNTEYGSVVYVFTSSMPKLRFTSYEKDQLILTIDKI
jgi:hypothetical protein